MVTFLPNNWITEIDRLRTERKELLEACKMALKTGTSYPFDSKARMDTATEEILKAAIAGCEK